MTFYDENTGYFASNRKGAKFETEEYCCNDIFSFQYKPNTFDTIKPLPNLNQHLPLALYFHNDQPDPNSTRATTKKNYKETYISYFLKRSLIMQKLTPKTVIFLKMFCKKTLMY